MGNVVAYDFKRGRLDSSILIRTMENFKKNRFYYAAGSGIVISSSPEQELAEICTKCKVLTAGIDISRSRPYRDPKDRNRRDL
jgi:anthranilate/para-aminobenzoate synthase component I